MRAKSLPPDKTKDGAVRGLVAIILLIIFGFAIIISLIYGIISGDFNAMEKVSLALGGPIAYVLGYYMGQPG